MMQQVSSTSEDIRCLLWWPSCRARVHIGIYEKFRTYEWQVLSFLILAGACSTGSVVDVLVKAEGPYCPPNVCSRYQMSAMMAFLSWSLCLASCLANLWLLPHLWFSFHLSFLLPSYLYSSMNSWSKYKRNLLCHLDSESVLHNGFQVLFTSNFLTLFIPFPLGPIYCLMGFSLRDILVHLIWRTLK